jgi:hypothetical protein
VVLGTSIKKNIKLIGLQLPMQLVPITTKVVSSNPVPGEMYSIQLYMIKFVSDLGRVGVFPQVLRIRPSIKRTATWNCYALNFFSTSISLI